VGPMKFSYAKPLNAKADDKLERFQFSLGQIF
jgi:outer membrane protein insertion porin family